MLKCEDTRSQLVAYIHNELPRRKRQRLAQHLQQCTACYADYVRERDAAQHLTRELTLLGQPTSPQLDSIWAVVATEVNTSKAASATSRSAYNWQHGVAWAALVILCMIPWTMTWDNLISVTSTFGVTPVDVPADTPESTRIGAAKVRVNMLQANFDVPTQDALNPTPTITPPAVPIPH